jgi:two-component system, response regulator RegA
MEPHSVNRVLVVDDDELFLRSFQLSAGREKWTVFTASDPVRARWIAKTEPLNLAVIDLRLGAANGIELVKTLRKDHEALKIALVSGYVSVAHAVEAVKAGADLVEAKPIDVRTMLLRITSGCAPSVDERFHRPSLARMQFEYISSVMTDCSGNVSMAARQLKIPRQSLQRRLKRPPPVQ